VRQARSRDGLDGSGRLRILRDRLRRQAVGGARAEPLRPDSETGDQGRAVAKAVTDVLTKYLKPTSDNPAHPGYAGAVALVKDGGRTLLRTAVGDAERPGRSADHGLGVEMNQPWFMGKLAAPTSFGHTGFTGTSLLVVPDREMVVVLLTNRAHPNWSWSNPDTHRVAVADAIAAD